MGLQKKYNEIKEKFNHANNLQEEHKELEMEYSDYVKNRDYKNWNAQDIGYWIISLDKDRYSKYHDILKQNLSNEGINGYCLKDLDKTDLHRLGLHAFTDKRDVYNQLQILVQNKNDEQQIEGSQR